MKTKLLLNNYAVTADGATIECNSKRKHSNLATVRIVLDSDTKQNRSNAEAVLAAALAESPGCLVGRQGNEILVVYRVESANGYMSYSNGEGAYPDRDLDQSGATRKFNGLVVTAESSGTFSPAAFRWDGGRSPATVNRDALAWAYSYVFTDVMRAARDIAGYPAAPPTEFEIAVAARKLRIARGEEAAPVVALTAEEIAAKADEDLVRGANPTLRGTDGLLQSFIAAARTRIARRAAAKAEAAQS